MKTLKILFLLIFTGIVSCNNITTNTERVNPTPAPEVKATVSAVPKFEFPVPDNAPVATEPPPPVLENFTFDVEIKFDATLARIYVDDGEIINSPAKYRLKGGPHGIIAFDLVTGCRIAKIITIDKNQVIEFFERQDC